ERSAHAGDLQAEARLLAERLRAGDVTIAGLRLAAFLEHRASQALCDGQVVAPRQATDWLARLDALALEVGPAAVPRAALGLARPVVVSDPPFASADRSTQRGRGPSIRTPAIHARSQGGTRPTAALRRVSCGAPGVRARDLERR